jgi:hypothetical protein
MMGVGSYLEDTAYFYYNQHLTTELKFAFLPKQCNLSGNRIWLKYAYRLNAVWNGPGTPVVETRWHDAHRHIIWKLKQ